jgi:hypothetical protein
MISNIAQGILSLKNLQKNPFCSCNLLCLVYSLKIILILMFTIDRYLVFNPNLIKINRSEDNSTE